MLVLPGREVDPAGQLPEHAVAPVPAWCMPATQLTQVDAAAAGANCPAAQRVHAALLVLAIVDVEPAGQTPVHAIEPELTWYIPGMQLEQLDAAAAAE